MNYFKIMIKIFKICFYLFGQAKNCKVDLGGKIFCIIFLDNCYKLSQIIIKNSDSNFRSVYINISAVFGSGSSVPPLVGPGGELVCEPVGMADLLSDHFDSKQSKESVDLLATCYPSPSLITFAFRSSEGPKLDLDPYGGTHPHGIYVPSLFDENS